jgi:hypothetical protein
MSLPTLAKRTMNHRPHVVLALCTLGAFILARSAPATPPTDVTRLIQTSLRNNQLIKLPVGQFITKGPLKIDAKTTPRFYLGGAVPITAWPQHYYQGADPHWTTIVATDLKPGEPWLQYTTPEGVNTGQQVIEDLYVQRAELGPILDFGIAGNESNLRAPNRGLLIRDCGFGGPNGPHWETSFKGRELPAATGAMIRLDNQYDARLEGVSCWGGETQLLATRCDRLRVRDWHGGKCARSIVCDGLTAALIDGSHVEDAGISGIDAAHAQVVNSRVEVGYQTQIGPSPLPAEAQWETKAGSNRVQITGVDATRWAPARSVIVLSKDKPLYVVDVDKDGFTFIHWDTNCQLKDGQGKGDQLVRMLGIPYIIRGDETALAVWRADIDKRTPGLPVAAFFPQGGAITVSDCLTAVDNTLFESNRAIVGAWSYEQSKQFWRGGHLWWTASEAYRPKHPRVFGPMGPHIDANKGLAR